jgi:hypothetical protein
MVNLFKAAVSRYAKGNNEKMADRDFNGRTNETLLINEKINDKPVEVKNCTGCKIIKCDFSYNKKDETMLILDNCVRCTVSECDFHDKNTYGLMIKIIGEKSKDNVIEGCKFSKFDYDGKENAEPVRIGDSRLSGCHFNTTIKYCHFDGLKADVETVSIKSCGNVLENNKHENCRSSFVIRHGGSNKIRKNLFIGSGGIRVYGDSNEIRGNYHKNNSSSEKPPLIIANGSFESDPNFDDTGKPRGEEGCGHAVYARTKNNVIEGNTYDNCEVTCVDWGYKTYLCDPNNDEDEDTGKNLHCKRQCGQKEYKLNTIDKEPLHPINNSFINNTIMADDGEEAPTVLKLAEKTKILDNNVFRGNKLYNAEPGDLDDLPKEAFDILPAKPKIEEPAAGPEHRS